MLKFIMIIMWLLITVDVISRLESLYKFFVKSNSKFDEIIYVNVITGGLYRPAVYISYLIYYYYGL